MKGKLLLGLLLVTLFLSCDKLKSISTNKSVLAVKENEEINLEKTDLYDYNVQTAMDALDKLNKKNKDGFDIYIDKNSPKFSTKECFYPYIKLEDGDFKLFLKVRHLDVDLLNINTCLLTVDSNDYKIKGAVEKTQLNGKKRFFVETLDKQIETEADMSALEAVAKGQLIEVVLVGENRFIKKQMSEKNRMAIYNVLIAYDYLQNRI